MLRETYILTREDGGPLVTTSSHQRAPCHGFCSSVVSPEKLTLETVWFASHATTCHLACGPFVFSPSLLRVFSVYQHSSYPVVAPGAPPCVVCALSAFLVASPLSPDRVPAIPVHHGAPPDWALHASEPHRPSRLSSSSSSSSHAAVCPQLGVASSSSYLPASSSSCDLVPCCGRAAAYPVVDASSFPPLPPTPPTRSWPSYPFYYSPSSSTVHAYSFSAFPPPPPLLTSPPGTAYSPASPFFSLPEQRQQPQHHATPLPQGHPPSAGVSLSSYPFLCHSSSLYRHFFASPEFWRFYRKYFKRLQRERDLKLASRPEFSKLPSDDQGGGKSKRRKALVHGTPRSQKRTRVSCRGRDVHSKLSKVTSEGNRDSAAHRHEGGNPEESACFSSAKPQLYCQDYSEAKRVPSPVLSSLQGCQVGVVGKDFLLYGQRHQGNVPGLSLLGQISGQSGGGGGAEEFGFGLQYPQEEEAAGGAMGGGGRFFSVFTATQPEKEGEGRRAEEHAAQETKEKPQL